MNFLWRSRNASGQRNDRRAAQKGPVSYESALKIDSTTIPGVSFKIIRVSFRRRMDLVRQVRELSNKVEFLGAGSELKDKIDANLLAQEIETLYLRWGLVDLDGLTIDGEAPTVDKLLDSGPEELVREIVRAIKARCGLSEAERKN